MKFSFLFNFFIWTTIISMFENQVILKVWSPDVEKSLNFYNEIIYLIIPSS